MKKFIIHPSSTGSVVLVIPAPECGLSVQEIARKDVPAGVPYLIVNNEDVPLDHEFFNAWEADFSNPHGYGIGQEAWFAEQKSKEQQ